MNLPPFEQGRSFASQFTARRMNDLIRSIPRIKFSGGGAKVSKLGDQVFVQMPRPIPPPTQIFHPYWVYDASTPSILAIRVIPGVHAGGSATDVVPTISGIPINEQTGDPLAYPKLPIGDSDTLLYFHISFDETATITDIEILSGSSIPASSITPAMAGEDYRFLSTIEIVGGTTVKALNDGVNGSQQWYLCGLSSLSVLM